MTGSTGGREHCQLATILRSMENTESATEVTRIVNLWEKNKTLLSSPKYAIFDQENPSFAAELGLGKETGLAARGDVYKQIHHVT